MSQIKSFNGSFFEYESYQSKSNYNNYYNESSTLDTLYSSSNILDTKLNENKHRLSIPMYEFKDDTSSPNIGTSIDYYNNNNNNTSNNKKRLTDSLPSPYNSESLYSSTISTLEDTFCDINNNNNNTNNNNNININNDAIYGNIHYNFYDKKSRRNSISLNNSALKSGGIDCTKQRRNGVKYDNIILPKKLTQMKRQYIYKLNKSNEIASGGQSSIYRGKMNSNHNLYNKKKFKHKSNEIAIKYMKNNKTLKNIFLLSTLKHPNIIKLYDYNMSPSGTRIIMEMCVMDLNDFYRKWLYKFRKARNYKDLTKQLCKIILDSLKGLIYIHSKYIIHHDIKPENIMLATKGDWKYIDFDLSIKVDNVNSLTQFYKYNGIQKKIGTIIYYAPEIILNDRHGPIIDVYSLGVTLYTIITGKNPFVHPKHGFKKQWAYHFIRKQEIKWNDRIWNKLINGKDIRNVIKNMMNKDCKDRVKPKECLKQICNVIKTASQLQR